MRSPILLLVLLAPFSFAIACVEDSTSAPATAVPEAGALPDGGGTTSPDGATTDPDGATTDGCSIGGDKYAIYGAQLFKVSADLTASVLVAKISNQNGLAFNSAGTATTGTQVGSTLVVSDPNCPFCSITLPPTIVDGTVKAEPITSGISNVHFLYSPSVPNNVVVWAGNGNTFLQYDLATKSAGPSAGIATNGPGMFCNELYSITGSIQTSSYDVRLLASCGDGSGPTFTYLIHAGGTKVGGNWQQDLFQTIASTKGMATNPQIEAGDITLGIYLGAQNKVYVESNGTFVPDTRVYSQCNATTGKSNPGARPLIAKPTK